ncbi:MAG TPA: choice-of-anchor tandem repeat GloVer-containing protein [Rhizomicrobium sp.]|jgi:uncharacterized repeat protein (TIGR03803 family)|nr:choice-of-anchor tandem repeat GloVer-containing protein [Rhizomicrobium sp.]
MYRVPRLAKICTILAGAFVAAAMTAGSSAAGVTVLYAFCAQANCSDGNSPRAGLITDGPGNLYGTTYYGGTPGCTNGSGCGTVFRITKKGAESVIYTFAGGSDGANPTAPLYRDATGNLYGTTTGGTTDGAGNVFKVAQDGTESVLYQFTGGSDGDLPYSGVIADAQGNLYGTTVFGGYSGNTACEGYNGCGVVYEVAPNGTETVLHEFNFAGAHDSAFPHAGLVMDKRGTMYGTATGNPYYAGDGNIFKIAPDGTYSVLFFFAGLKNGARPYANLIAAGKHFFGTTSGGGPSRAGTVFDISKGGKLNTLFNFTGGSDGDLPIAPLITDKNGNLYGTTEKGGANGDGTVFEVAPDGTESVLYSFTGADDGADPIGGLIAMKGFLYGTTSSGGQYGGGTVFKVPE